MRWLGNFLSFYLFLVENFNYQEKVEEMKEAIMAIVKDLESHVVQDVLIAQKVHPVSFCFFDWKLKVFVANYWRSRIRS